MQQYSPLVRLTVLDLCSGTLEPQTRVHAGERSHSPLDRARAWEFILRDSHILHLTELSTTLGAVEVLFVGPEGDEAAQLAILRTSATGHAEALLYTVTWPDTSEVRRSTMTRADHAALPHQARVLTPPSHPWTLHLTVAGGTGRPRPSIARRDAFWRRNVSSQR